MPIDLSVTLFDASLAMSAAAVVLFLWLVREGPKRRGQAPPPAAPPSGRAESRPPE